MTDTLHGRNPPSGQFNLDTGTRLALLEVGQHHMGDRLSKQEEVLESMDIKLDKVLMDVALMARPKHSSPAPAPDTIHFKIPKSLFTAAGALVGGAVVYLVKHYWG